MKDELTLVGGLTIEKIESDYTWLLNADISDAVIGEDVNGLVWYDGKWISGEWKDGTWCSGYFGN